MLILRSGQVNLDVLKYSEYSREWEGQDLSLCCSGLYPAETLLTLPGKRLFKRGHKGTQLKNKQVTYLPANRYLLTFHVFDYIFLKESLSKLISSSLV